MAAFSLIKAFIKNDDPASRIKWSLYGRVWREFGRPYWKLLLAGVACTVAAAGAEAFSISLVKNIVDRGFIERNMDSLVLISGQIIAAYFAKGLFSYAKTLAMTRAGLLGISGLRRRVYRQMMRQPLGFYHNTHTGDVMNYCTTLAGAVLSLVTDNVISIAQNSATSLMMAGLMFWYAPQLSVVLLILVPAVVVPLVVITRKRNVLTRRGFGVEADSNSHIVQSIEGVKTIQSFGNEELESRRMDAIEDQRIAVNFKSAKLSGMQTPILEAMISVGLAAALLLGGYFITSGAISTGAFTAFMLALTAAYKPAKSLTNINGGIQRGLIAAEGLFDFLDREPAIVDAPGAVALGRGPMAVRLEGVTFAYDEAEGDVLHDVSLEVGPGQVCALVGQSGGGKSTIFNLLERFYEPRLGRLLINGRDIREYTLASLRGAIAGVSQDVFLFSGTVAENIRYGRPGATQAEVEAAARAANAHGFIMEFPQGYQSQVGERGAILSGGQQQRLAIARAILKDAPILLLDEATSALDSESEKLIQDALKTLMRGRTTFVIAHRLATILDADQICVVKEGRVAERGTDAELCALGGEYARLKGIQFRGRQAGAE